MKKKLSMLLAAFMVVCTFAIALVACAPKDPDPFTAVDSSKELGNVWDAWAKEHMKVSGNTLGINASLNLKNSDTDMSIALQGGITQENNVKEVLRLAIANNKKTGDNKNIVDIIINDTDGLFVNIDGLSAKPIKISELKLPSIGDLLKDGLDMSISDIIPAIKPAVVELINFALDDSKVTVDPVKNKKTYDVRYTFTVEVDALVNSILDMINLQMSPEVESIVNEVKGMLDGVDLKFTVDTTGNTQTKVKKPAKGAPKYDYAGGTMTDLKIEVEGMTVNATGINLTNTIPNVSIPTDTMDLDTALLTSRLNGKITLKDSAGKSVGDYTYTINLDFTPIQLITTITECVNTGSADPIIKKMLLDQQGKIFIEVNHTCGTTCKTTHVDGKKTDGSIIAIAYSPKDFENNRIYVSLDLRSIVNDSLLSDMIGIGLNSIFPTYYTTFSFDVLQYLDLVKTRAEADAPVGSETPEEQALAYGLVSDSPMSIGNIITDIIGGLKDKQELQIKVDYFRELLDGLYGTTLDEGTYWTLLKAVNSLFNGVDKICIDGVYSNGEHFEQNVLDLYTRVKDGSDAKKDFGENEESLANHKIIKGEVLDWDKDAAGNVKIYQGGDKDNPNTDNLNSVVYNTNGSYKTMSYGELMELVVDKNATSTKNTVVIKFKDIYGKEVTSRMNIVEIAGLNPNIYTEQTVKLVLSNGGVDKKSAGIGSSINNLLAVLKTFSSLVPQLSMLNDLVTPEVVIETKITIAEVENVVWDQSKVAGINSSQIFDEDPEKVYANGDALSDTHHITVNFANGEIHETDVKASNTANFVSNNKVAAWGTFPMQFAAFGYTKEVIVNMNDALGVDNQTISLMLTDGKVSYKIANSIKNNVINASMKLQQAETMAAVGEFADANGFEYSESSSLLGWNGANITFNKKGTYTLSLKGGHNAVLNLTFIIIEHHVDETMYMGVTKTYNGKIGVFAFTKAEAEKAADLNTNANMTIAVSGTDTAPVIEVSFTRTGKYTMTIVDKNGDYVIVNYDVKEAAQTVSGLELNIDNQIKLNELFTDVRFEKEVIVAAVEKLNNDNTDKITMTFNGDMENPILTVNAIDNNGYSGYVMNMTGTNNEIAKLTIKFNTKTVEKTAYVGGDKVVVTEDEIGVPFTKEFAEKLANTQNTGSNKTKMTVAVLELEDGKLALEFTVLQPNNNTFTLTNKCSIKINAKLVAERTAVVGTDLVFEKGTDEGQLNHSYSKYNFTSPVSDFNDTYAGKANVTLNESTLALTFNFTEAGEYELVVVNMTIKITVTAAEA